MLRNFIALLLSRSKMASSSSVHTKARSLEYLGGPNRSPVPDDKVLWSVEWKEYTPTQYTALSVLKGPVWADPDITKDGSHKLKFYEMDGNINRVSFEGKYDIVDGLPRNPSGRTGMRGRGLLGKWGPNHAADPIVTRWLRNEAGEKVVRDGKPILEVVLIRRADSGAWALPGGMVDSGDTVSATLKKEFGEEALNSLEATEERKKELEAQIGELFKNGEKIYAGYVDDPRNTDNAWMETVAVNFHDDTGKAFDSIKLQAGDDAKAVAWTQANSTMELYASHRNFVEKTVQLRGAAW